MQSDCDNVYLGVGSNLGDRWANLGRAVDQIDALATTAVTAVSPVYETQPRLYTDQPDFLNACVKLQTTLSPAQLLAAVLAVERDVGRVRTVDNGPRVIDVDILLFGQHIIDREGLDIPHPGLDQRAFVLAPLADIGADARHPGLGRRVAELVERCPDVGWVRRVGRLCDHLNCSKKLVPTSQSTPK